MSEHPEKHHEENHRIHRSGGLRAAVLGANDGIVSVASIIVGVSAAGTSTSGIMLAGTAGLVAGACAMAAGEYVSVKSQEDTERADLAMEAEALKKYPEEEMNSLSSTYNDPIYWMPQKPECPSTNTATEGWCRTTSFN